MQKMRRVSGRSFRPARGMGTSGGGGERLFYARHAAGDTMRLKTAAHIFLVFGLKQAYACLFGGWLLGVIVVTAFWYPFHGLYRYDFLFLAAVAFQLLLLATK